MTKERLPWFPCDPGKLLGALNGMGPDEQLVYVVCLLRIYETGGSIKDDAEILSRRTHLSLKRVQVALDILFSTPNKLYRTTEGNISNSIAEDTLSTMRDRREVAVRTGQVGADAKWKKSRQQQQQRQNRMNEARQQGTHSDLEWGLLVEFCGGKCLGCGNPKYGKDHIKPIHAGGSDGIENIQPLCKTCNSKKGSSVQDHRKKGWENVVFSKKRTLEPHKEVTGYLDLQLEDSEVARATSAPEAVDARTELFRKGLATLTRTSGRTVDSCRSLIGRWLKVSDDDAVCVLRVIEDAERNRVADAVPWIEGALKSRKGSRSESNGANREGGSVIDAADRLIAGNVKFGPRPTLPGLRQNPHGFLSARPSK